MNGEVETGVTTMSGIDVIGGGVVGNGVEVANGVAVKGIGVGVEGIGVGIGELAPPSEGGAIAVVLMRRTYQEGDNATYRGETRGND